MDQRYGAQQHRTPSPGQQQYAPQHGYQMEENPFDDNRYNQYGHSQPHLNMPSGPDPNRLGTPSDRLDLNAAVSVAFCVWDLEQIH